MIQASGLTMMYGPVTALADASFEVKPGEVVGLLGPNGAGKSTTMKILTTYLSPTAGTAKVAGHDIREEPLQVRRKIGYLPEVVPLYLDMEVRDYLVFVGRARGLSGDALKARLEWVVEHCGLRPMFRKPIRQLSKGYRQRTGLAQALIHDPEVVILDEPTSGLDPHQIIEIRKLIRMLAEKKTVILSTHILQEVEAVSDRLVIISQGTIVGDGTVDDLRRKTGQGGNVRVAVAGADAGAVESKLRTLPGVSEVSADGRAGGSSCFRVRSRDSAGLLREVGRLARAESWELAELAEHPPSLEEIFLALTAGDKGRKSDAA
jgi:ABC-2 type transport system ATP-binding protein